MRVVFGCLLAVLVLPVSAFAEEPPTPRVDRVNYEKPAEAIAMGPKVSAGQRTQGIAGQLKGGKAVSPALLSTIVRWADRNLRIHKGVTPAWRTMEDILTTSRVASQGERAYALGALARASGFPVAWVKTVRQDWLKKAKPDSNPGSDDTRTFLEVYIEKRWQLLDPVTSRLYDNYDTRRRLLPGGYLAYDKGIDPHGLVLDNRPELFRAQLAAFVRAFDARRLPWATSRDLLARWRVYVTGQSGPATYAKEAARTLGFKVEAKFDSGWEENLATARGKILIVTMRGGQPLLPERYRATWLPAGWQEAVRSGSHGGKGWIAHKLRDGTRVVLVLGAKYGQVELAVSEALES